MDFQHVYSVPFRGSDLSCPEDSLTQQQFKEDSDINVMLERFKVTGVMPQGVRMPTYGDFTGISDYRSAVEAIHKAEIAFMELPANVRNRFDNDPQKFMEFFAKPENAEEAKRLGLVIERPEVPPTRVEVINPAKPDAKPSGGQPA